MAQLSKNNDCWSVLKDQLTLAWPPDRWRDVGVVVGCSGGADSVCLLRAINELRLESHATPPRGFVVMAHYNHGIRATESDDDERFVRGLAADLGTRVCIGNSDDSATDESALRSQRLAFLQSAAEQAGARYVALAHSSDDNVETVLHHLLRGTGPAGLTGIPPNRPLGEDLVLIRPLLAIPRKRIREALQSVGQAWREDSSNLNTDYRRNWIRRKLVPLIESKYPKASQAITRTIETQRQWQNTVGRLADDWLDEHWIKRDPVELRHDQQTDESVLVAAVQCVWTRERWPRGSMSLRHWQQLTEAIRSTRPRRFTLPQGIKVDSNAECVRIVTDRG